MSGDKIKIAICGGGIAGLCLLYGLSLQDRLDVTLYEASAEISGDEGSGIGLACNAIRALKMMGEPLVDAIKKSDSVPLSDPVCRVMVGETEERVCDIGIRTGEIGYLFQRSKFVKQLFRLVSADKCQTSKTLNTIEKNPDESLNLTFTDGTTTTVDAVIGADGIHSNARKYVLSKHPDEVSPIFSKLFMYNLMVSMDEAKKALGTEHLQQPLQYAWIGNGGFLLHDPANNEETLQIIAACITDEVWREDQWTRTSTEEEVRERLGQYGKIGKACAELIISHSDPIVARSIWEHPKASTYHNGHAAIMGDAAHSMQPWQAAGAGQAIEDALILTTLFGHPQFTRKSISAALAAYTSVRRKRTQAAQKGSAETGAVIMGRDLDRGVDWMREMFPRWWDELLYFDLEDHREMALLGFEMGME